MMPSDLDSERGLLASILIDSEILGRIGDLDTEVFYDPVHQDIFVAMLAARDAGKSVDEITIAEHLKEAGRLESVGGFAGLNQLAATVETSANANWYADQVRESWKRRRILDTSARLAELARNGADADELIALLDKAREQFDSGASIEDRLADRTAEIENEPPEEPVILSLAGRDVLHAGNVGVVVAPIKSGKSAFVGSTIAAAVGGSDCDLLGISPIDAGGRAVIHLDTEQSRKQHWQLLKRAARRAGVDTLPPSIMSYCLTGWEPADLWAALETTLRRADREHGGTHAVILDGVADFVRDPNEIEPSFAAVRRLTRLAESYRCGIVCILHHNPGSEKSRGHLGSQIERKAEMILQLSKDADEVVSLMAPNNRGASIPKKEAIRFRYDPEHGMHRLLPSEGERRRAKAETEAVESLRAAWSDAPASS